jgi:hypothetical protein
MKLLIGMQYVFDSAAQPPLQPTAGIAAILASRSHTTSFRSIKPIRRAAELFLGRRWPRHLPSPRHPTRPPTQTRKPPFHHQKT